MSPRLGIALPAAGASRRMAGRDKLLEPIHGTALLARQTRAALDLEGPVLVTLPQLSPARLTALEPLRGPRLYAVPIEDANDGMSGSLRAAGRWSADQELNGLMILLPDLPGLDTADLRQMAAEFFKTPGQVIRGRDATGQPGHPVILPQRLFGALQTLTGDRGAGALISGMSTTYVDLPDHHATEDLDTPDAWTQWRVRTGIQA